MPKPLSFTPPWLSRPSDGFDFFQLSQSKSSAGFHDTPIAHRGTEVFAAVGNELRWTDFVLLKEEWEASESDKRRSRNFGGKAEPRKYPYRTLKTPVTREIKQLIVSPANSLLAIITTHTVHIAILPDSSHLSVSFDTTPIRLKCFQLGPTDHVLERSQIASTLWHPLGVNGTCLVTITVDAVARMWELDTENRWSFDRPALAVDLKKLANGTGVGGDFSPSKYSTSKGFSPDDFELEVATAYFGGKGQEHENVWASLTLWIAMKNGDIYALCPFIPSRWTAPHSLVSSIVSAVSMKSNADDTSDMQTLSKQITWASDIDEQTNSTATETGIYKRPSHTSSVPTLQGPLRIQPDTDDVFDVTDMFVIAGKEVDEDAELAEVDESEQDRDSMQVGFVLVGTSDGRIHVCLDVAGVEARWPSKSHRPFSPQRQETYPELLLVETIEASRPGTSAGILFTEDAVSRNAVFFSHEHGVSHLDLSSWSRKIREELNGFDSGSDFRLDLLVENARAHIQHILHIKDPRARLAPPSNLMANGEDLPTSSSKTTASGFATINNPSTVFAQRAINISDTDLGHFLFTVTNHTVHSAVLDDPQSYSLSASDTSDYSPETNPFAIASIDPDNKHAIPADLREAYQPPSIFWEESTLLALPSQPNLERIKRLMNHPIQISPITLKFLIEAHRVLSAETTALGEGAADLFRRCERLRDELKEQVRRDADVAARIDSVLNEDADDYRDNDDAQTYGVNAAIDRRIDAAQARQQVLDARYAELKRKAATLVGRPLSDKETEWQHHIDTIARSTLGPSAAAADTDPSTPADETLPQMRPNSADDGDDSFVRSLAKVKLEDPDDASADAHTSHTRLAQLAALKADLLERAQAHMAAARDAPAAERFSTPGAADGDDADDDTALAASMRSARLASPGVVDDRRSRQSYAHIRELLERETALVEAAARKAVRLGGWVAAPGVGGGTEAAA